MAMELKNWIATFWEDLVNTQKNPAAIKCLKDNKFVLPFEYVGDTCDALRVFTHEDDCGCYNCLARTNYEQMDKDRWEGSLDN